MWALFRLGWFLFLFLLVCTDVFMLVRIQVVSLVSFRRVGGLAVVDVLIVADMLRVCTGRRYFWSSFRSLLYAVGV